MFAENDFTTGACQHRSCRHGHVGHDHAKIVTEHLVKIFNDCPSCFNLSAGRMQNNIKSSSPIQTVHDGHHSIHIQISESYFWMKTSIGKAL